MIDVEGVKAFTHEGRRWLMHMVPCDFLDSRSVVVDDQENRGKRKAWRTCQARSHRLTISVISLLFKLLSYSLEFDVQELWTLI